MEFRDLKKQYMSNRDCIDSAIGRVLENGIFIGGAVVRELEEKLAAYVGAKHCISCANGTDALQLALMAWGITKGDAVFVPDFTFFSTAEVIPWVDATPVFVDVDRDTFNISPQALEKEIRKVIEEGKLIPKVIIAVDLFGLPADYPEISRIAKQYDLLLLEDGAQGFGGKIGNKMACSFGDIATTSFFPAKPLGCYGDGGAIFTDNDEWAELISSYKVHGKGKDKYDNMRIGLNSRLDTIQAAILMAKYDKFVEYELDSVNVVAALYSENLCGYIKIPKVQKGFYSSWAQYTIQLENRKIRDGLQNYLKECNIPSMIYYAKSIHQQLAFLEYETSRTSECMISEELCNTVLSLPMHPYITETEIRGICECISNFLNK